MTQRYVPLARAPRAWQSEGGDYWAERPTIAVWETERAPVDTGLLDASGTRLYRVNDPEPIGFRPRKGPAA